MFGANFFGQPDVLFSFFCTQKCSNDNILFLYTCTLMAVLGKYRVTKQLLILTGGKVAKR